MDPLELVTVVNLSVCCLLSFSKVMEPLWEETVRLWALTLATEMDADSVWITMSFALSTTWRKIGRLKDLISKFPMLEGREMVISTVRRGAVADDKRESPPVEMEMLLSFWWMRMLSLSEGRQSQQIEQADS